MSDRHDEVRFARFLRSYADVLEDPSHEQRRKAMPLMFIVEKVEGHPGEVAFCTMGASSRCVRLLERMHKGHRVEVVAMANDPLVRRDENEQSGVAKDEAKIFFILEGRRPVRVGFDRWFAWRNDVNSSAITVGITRAGDRIVSTIFVGIPTASLGEEQLPFETLVREMKGTVRTIRYATWEEAEEGHARVVTEETAR